MAITIALSSRPFSPTALTGVGVVAGQTCAVPSRSAKENTLAVSLVFSADPGASQFTLDVSNDGINWTVYDNWDAPDNTPMNRQYLNFSFVFVRLSQVSKTNAVTATPTFVLG